LKINRTIIGVIIVEDRNSEFKNDNRTRVLKKILKRQGYEIEEQMIIVLGEAITFLFNNINYSLTSNINLWYASSFNIQYEKNVFEKLDMKKEDFNNIENKQLINFIDKKIKDNHVICYVDEEIFKNYKAANSTKIPTVRNLTSVEVIDIDFHNKEVVIEYAGENVEGIIDDRLKVPFEKFLIAAYSNSLPVSPNGSGYTIEKNSFCKNNNPDLDRIILKSIINICRNNLGESQKEQDICVGVMGMKNLLDELKLFNDHVVKENSNKEVLDKLFSIRFRILRKTLLYGSNSLYRMQFADAIKKLSVQVNSKELDSISKDISLIGRRWLNFTRVISIANFRVDKKEEFLKVAYEGLDLIMREETEVFSNLEFVVSKIIKCQEE
jgi:hypothetical protein